MRQDVLRTTIYIHMSNCFKISFYFFFFSLEKTKLGKCEEVILDSKFHDIMVVFSHRR